MSRLFFIPLLLLCYPMLAQNVNPNIHVDQFGYLSDFSKVAVLVNPQTGFNSSESYTPSSNIQLIDVETDEVVFEGSPAIWNGGATHTGSGDQGWWFDFSSVTTPGTYIISDPNFGESHPFEINDNTYQEVLAASTKMFFYNRCNAEKEAAYTGENWSDGESFMNNLQDGNCRYVYDQGNATLEKDLSGGWFDAGDFNKYVTFAESAVHDLLWAYQENPQAFSDETNIPESGNSYPDIIDEVVYELEWLMKMSNPDGSVHIKMGSISYDENVSSPPSANTDPRYYGPTCTSASLAAAGMFAHAYEVLNGFSTYSSFADDLLEQAELCWNYSLPFIESNTLEFNCDDGTILSGDADRNQNEQIRSAIIAAIHLFAATGDTSYDDFLQVYAPTTEPVSIPFWGPYTLSLESSLLRYTQIPGANSALVNNIISSVTTDVSNNYNGMFGFNNDDLYRAFMPAWSYHWGSNSPKAGYGILNKLIADYNLLPALADDLNLKAYEQVHYFHGVNPLGLVQLSNMYSFGAEESVNEIYHGWFADGTDYDHALLSPLGPAPGYLTGGANSQFSITTMTPPAGQPDQKSYLDFNDDWPLNSWEISEPGIYYQARYVRLLANFVSEEDPGSCNGDFNGDQHVDILDLLILLADYGCTEGCELTDMDQSGAVNIGDVAFFLANFGITCN